MSFEIRALREEELPAWFTHLAEVFQGVGREHFMNHWFEDPHRDLSGILVAMDGKNIASTLRVFARRIHAGGALLTMGGIGEVSTNPSYRRQGLSGKLLQAAVQFMHQRHYATSVLFTGLTDHYGRYGWERVSVPYLSFSNWNSELALGQGIEIRPIKYGDDLYAVQRIHQLTAERFVGPVARSASYWWTYIRRKLQNSFVAERQGRVLAYLLATYGDGVLRISEFGALPGEEGALQNLIVHARASLSAPEDSPLSAPAALDQLLQGQLSAMAHNVEKGGRAPMFRIVNASALAMQMRPVWERRLKEAGWHGSVCLDIGVGAFDLHMEDDALRILPSSGAESKVTLEHRQFLEMLYNGRHEGTSEMVEGQRFLLETLFPPVQNVYWYADGF